MEHRNTLQEAKNEEIEYYIELEEASRPVDEIKSCVDNFKARMKAEITESHPSYSFFDDFIVFATMMTEVILPCTVTIEKIEWKRLLLGCYREKIEKSCEKENPLSINSILTFLKDLDSTQRGYVLREVVKDPIVERRLNECIINGSISGFIDVLNNQQDNYLVIIKRFSIFTRLYDEQRSIMNMFTKAVVQYAKDTEFAPGTTVEQAEANFSIYDRDYKHIYLLDNEAIDPKFEKILREGVLEGTKYVHLINTQKFDSINVDKKKRRFLDMLESYYGYYIGDV